MRTLRLCSLALCSALVLAAAPSFAAAPPDDRADPDAASATSAAADPSVAAAADDDDDAAIDLAEPDFRVVNLPTTMRLPRYKGNFTLTHRFGGNLRKGSFGDKASSLFGLDEGATVGFEYRFAVARHLQAVAYRTAFQRTIQFHAKYDALHQGRSVPLSLSAIVSDEAVNNYQDQHAQAIGVTVSRKVGEVAAVYAVPFWVHNSAANSGVTRSTGVLGLGARVRIASSVYVAGEASPRISGYKQGTTQYGFAVEKRIGGHFFQLNFTNSFGTTYAQIARGGAPQSLSLGFNLIRKFY
jgi:hypothetical protein